jgi:RNA polymerase sigma-70 factor (ECF subfamily)
MSLPDDNPDPASAGAGQFATTHWSVILQAGRSESAAAQAALAELCRVYWPPLYAYLRRQGHSPEDAKDLTQEFFARLLARRVFTAARPERGRFRSWLLMTLKRFLANEWHRARARKRGGGQELLSIDAHLAESRCGAEPAHGLSADVVFERQWAATLLDQVLVRLEREYAAAGKGKLFQHLKDCLTPEGPARPYAEVAAQAGLTEAAVKVAAHRLRARYRELLRLEIAKTVSTPAEVEEEIRHLLATFSG